MKETTKTLIREMMREETDNGLTAGVSVLVRQNGEELFFGAEGFADRENAVRLARDTIFRLYSMTKPVTAAAAMILAERGRLDLNMPVHEVLPGFRSTQVCKDGILVPADRNVTVLHLLNMTSGITYGDETTPEGRELLGFVESCMKRMGTANEVTTCEFADGIGRIPLAFQPDSSWCYGFSADVLGAVIEKVSGMRFGEFLEKNIFEPLNMKDTGFFVPDDKRSRLASAYRLEDGTLSKYTGDHLMISNSMRKAPGFESGGAGLVSTIDDYARFAQMLLNRGELDGVRILSPKTVDHMLSGELTFPQQAALRQFGGHEGFTYSHLFRRLIDPGQACLIGDGGEYGWSGWLGCYFENIPGRNMTVLLMQQKYGAGTAPLTRRIRNVLSTE